MSDEFGTLVDEIKSKWDESLVKYPDIFRYMLNIQKEKILDGKFNFLVQVKIERKKDLKIDICAIMNFLFLA